MSVSGVTVSNGVGVLVTGMGSATGISVVKALRKQTDIAVRIVGTDINQESEIAGSRFCDSFYTVPGAVEENYIPKLLQICDNENIRVLFPIIDAELVAIAKQVKAFEGRPVHIWLSDLETILTCGDKYQTYRFFIDNGFPTPRSWLPEEIEVEGAEFSFPAIVKPRNGVGSIDVFKIHDIVELRSALGRIKCPVVQEYVEGREFTIDVVTDTASQVLAVVPRERIETKAGISFKARTVRDEQLISYAGRIAQALRIKGHCNIQCRIAGNQPRFFEVNPRFSAALPLTTAAGVNSPLILIKLCLQREIDRSSFDFKEGVYMARYWEEVFYRAT